MKIRKSSDKDDDIDADLITVNNFFVHLIKEISVTRYENYKQLIPTFSLYDTYKYSDSTLKHLPKDSLKKLEKTVLYSKQAVYYNKTTIDKRTHNSTRLNDIKYLSINKRIIKFENQPKNEFVYRIPLRYFTHLGKINFPLKIDFRIKCHLETDKKKLFESKKKVATIGSPDVKIIFTKPPFRQYEQFLLDKTFRQYLQTMMVSKKF